MPSLPDFRSQCPSRFVRLGQVPLGLVQLRPQPRSLTLNLLFSVKMMMLIFQALLDPLL